jgi:hypothetical protein
VAVLRVFFCVFLLVLAGACRDFDRRHFAGLETAGKDIETAIDAKAGLPRYRESLDRFSAELANAKPRIQTSREREVLSQYEAAYRGLTDIRLVWEASEARGSDMLPIREELAARVAHEYDLGVNTNEPPSIYAGEALQTIWTTTRTKLEEASRMLNGR